MKRLIFALLMILSMSSLAGMKCTGESYGLEFESEALKYNFVSQTLPNWKEGEYTKYNSKW